MDERRRARLWQPAAVAALVLAALGARLIALGQTPLIADEAYYRLWSQRLDWSYWDHPAGTALLIRLSTALGGDDEFGLRWLNALVGTVCVVLIWALGRRLYSWRAGGWAAAILAVGAPYLVTARLVYTDALHLCALLVNLWCLTPLLDLSDGQAGESSSAGPSRTGSTWQYLLWGVSLALLFNTKYSAYLYALGLGVVVLCDHRGLLSEPRFWGALGIGALGLLPVLLWNAAHGWGSLAWQLSHLITPSPGGSATTGWLAGLAGNISHAWRYLTWPVVISAALGLCWPRRKAERLLLIPAFAMLLPVLLSPANSPRNLTVGLALLLILAGAKVERWGVHSAQMRLLARAAAGGLLCAAVIYGAGTLAGLHGRTILPRSSLVIHVRDEMAVTRALAQAAAPCPAPYLTIDYNLAAVLSYVSGEPAYTTWGQYRIWGIPALKDVTVVSLDYVPEEAISERLAQAFERVQGPERVEVGDTGRYLRFWRAEGLRWDQERLLQELDFLALSEAAR